MQKSYDLQDSKFNKQNVLKKNALKRNTNELREYKKTITLNPMQREVIVGTPFGLPAKRPSGPALGDACIPLDRGKPTLRVHFVQTITRA